MEPASDRWFATISPATEDTLAEVAEAGDEDVERAVAAAREAFEQRWRDIPGAERAKYLYRIARQLQERAREFAVLETMNGGKPIRESARRRRAARGGALLLPRGLGGQARVRVPACRSAAGRRGGADHPVELPAADGSVEARAGARCREHRGAEAGRDHAAHRAAARRGDPRGRPSAGRRERPARPGRPTGAALVRHPGVDKIAFTGSTDVGKQIQRQLAGTGKRLTLELGGKAANIVFEDAPVDQAVEGIVNGIYFNQGHVCCAGSRLLVQESVFEEVLEKLKARLGTLRVGDPLDKNTDVGAINSRRAAREDPGAGRERHRRGRRDLPGAVRPAGPWVLVRAHAVHERLAVPHGSPARRSSGLSCRSSRSAPRKRPSRRRTTPRTGCRRGSGPRRAR